jgi:hypothetical protein
MAHAFEVDADEIIANVRKCQPTLEESSSREFKLVPVKSYVQSLKTVSSGMFSGVVVPSFAMHWGVAIRNTLYHLVFENRDDARIDLADFSRYGKPIRFIGTTCRKDSFEHCPVVGETKYDHETRLEIGEALIEAFGNYHRLFWNCQVFAKCFLYCITGKDSFVE